MKGLLASFLLLTLVAPLIGANKNSNSSNTTYNVLDFGAVGDGSADDSQAFKEAWQASCMSSDDSPIMLIPNGKTFLLRPVTFSGGCKSNNIHVQINGNIIAPSEHSQWGCYETDCDHWITFANLDGLYIDGSNAIIDGQGSKWWSRSCQDENNVCHMRPNAFFLEHANNVHIKNLNFMNSPGMHLIIERSTWVYVSNVTITAPQQSPNTDGIHIQESTNVFIYNSSIGTGDDCISIGGGTSYLNISGISCGPGHGISIGSLGREGREEQVEYVHVSNIQFKKTSNGVRIKTWRGGKGYARNIVFEQIVSHGAVLPIVIDQNYCDVNFKDLCVHNLKSAVQVSNITYNNVYGTSDGEIAVKFDCSEVVSCTNISLNNVNIPTTIKGEETKSSCINTHGRARGEVVPMVPCLLRY
uniref:endo-polygalacturonase n=1 Tax=Nelumbo nucifera TaxID=4432 RepID=A0A822ZSG7_NELNU|nr:TPA_asm: hypothetical protein HUJ06_017750 [Nelumbo nucifera]